MSELAEVRKVGEAVFPCTRGEQWQAHCGSAQFWARLRRFEVVVVCRPPDHVDDYDNDFELLCLERRCWWNGVATC
ncbi:MAG: hypothetical protein ACREUQ_01040 [Burkholderiales bacterium]